MDEYWQKFGEELAKKKQNNIAIQRRQFIQKPQRQNLINERQNKSNNKFENHIYAVNNKTRWPKGTDNVFKILTESKIKFKREKVIGLGTTFRQVDFAIQKLKIFLEIDGPEHVEEADKQREQQILGRIYYKDWTFIRIKSDIAANEKQCRTALKPIIEEWSKLP